MSGITRTGPDLDRRGVTLGLGALALLAACGNPIGSDGPERLDARVDAARDFLKNNYPSLNELFDKSHGILFIPVVTEAGLFVGGAYGQGALRINDATVDYYSATRASLGLQAGAQQYAHALFFMTEQALSDFRRSEGWAASADLRYAVPTRGGSMGAETTTQFAPVIAVVFGQSGLIAGASLAGVRYRRIVP
ncbi:lipid-binding SYLF domain-containing protein [Rhodobacteraceae bacterium 2376]|uniref:Lipid-binding SYLF domain-containing protein n=1 Tax=Rhabdonatronobacter sediminivivens TaxID=2743469 RepID=A0A7Z0I0I5_9RHOB|nr:lipid-binding SYLF domain-containing protein [Rhabdonatronobacter sediminivivens]NYS25710.1 lipid-binding SYLF domain-containing protein [Rhabdonatronobacter sediminivivens]